MQPAHRPGSASVHVQIGLSTLLALLSVAVVLGLALLGVGLRRHGVAALPFRSPPARIGAVEPAPATPPVRASHPRPDTAPIWTAGPKVADAPVQPRRPTRRRLVTPEAAPVALPILVAETETDPSQ